MHIDYTVNFWTLILQISAISGFFVSLYKSYKASMVIVDACKLFIAQSREVYEWYQSVKEQVGPPRVIAPIIKPI